MFAEATRTRLSAAGVVPVVVINDAAQAVPLARALLAGGVGVIELTLRTAAGLDAIKAIATEVPDMLVGAGTVLTTEQVREVHAAGAAFAVAPGTSRTTLAAALEVGLPFAPGVMTPSDIETAMTMGCRMLKFFPAESAGGVPHLKAMSAPYAHLGVKFMPTGGIKSGQLADYLAVKTVAAVGGSWLATAAQIDAGDWDAITAQAADAMAIVRQARG
ncbi:bifunctional 4-hydroxy-2-oxoglutarate aldolase/2-dehydro-3-deoxy-phosphogluconate aldolase [Synoicihabitans lomoniglobus]|uniref:2-dehydro-3-deoxy-phosphogluconate aldolase n=1 Tax=Synoicihabitans lomoniglobus TaxID=2909285 RepID=A0AAF0CSH9_9BACT|nr:bifunctional 4-hydroxy-2-oxoglutarate aldolase/2-dehydro-3-deoxy-phosphogluconate aldolase [Opitutaceae bacterium LMO-M01]WED67233.1 bifunctional 4-hydroxy-2-oxoglutarate aldolase/2-dehydro-3-deoxy-phosphogluconate aldolase [Opitutaceae bacterium LMO-M01]